MFKKSCFNICDVVNDGVCMGVCTAGLDPTKYTICDMKDNVVSLMHPELNKPLVTYNKSEFKKVKTLRKFVIKLREAN